MPSRNPSGLPVDPDRLKAHVVSSPSALEDGFRVLDVDLTTGRAGSIDILGLDRHKTFTLVAVSSGEPDAALLRLLDQQVWVADQRDLLRRIHAHTGVDISAPPRGLLLSPGFTERFLRRLDLLRQPVTAYLARALSIAGKSQIVIEEAAPLFGLAGSALAGDTARLGGPTHPGDPAPLGDGARHDDAGDRPARAPRSSDERRDRPRPFEPQGKVEEAEPVFAELVVEESGEAAALPDPFAEEAEPADPFEPLSEDEMDEFERFERDRISRKRNPA